MTVKPAYLIDAKRASDHAWRLYAELVDEDPLTTDCDAAYKVAHDLTLAYYTAWERWNAETAEQLEQLDEPVAVELHTNILLTEVS